MDFWCILCPFFKMATWQSLQVAWLDNSGYGWMGNVLSIYQPTISKEKPICRYKKNIKGEKEKYQIRNKK